MTKARDLANSAAAFASVSATELGYVDGVTSAIQTQMDAKAPSSTAVTLTGTQTLTNKTLTSPVIASVINNTLTTTTGDVIYASAANTPARLGIGSSAQVLTVSSGLPAWTTASSGALTLINSTTFSGASSVAVDSVFTSTYENYFIQTNFTSATGANQTLSMRMRAGGTSYTGGDYFTLGGRFYAGNVAAVGGVSTGFDLHSIEATNGNYAHNTIQLLAPQAAVFTKITSFGLGYQTSPAYTTNAIHMGGLLQTTTQYDGFLMYVASGNIAGTVKIYGYQN